MPNWCGNDFYVQGSRRQLKRFIKMNMGYPVRYPPIKGEKEEKESREKHFCFNAMIRTPQEVINIGYDGGDMVSEELMKKARETGADVFPIDGYNWNIANWGTKWDIYNEKITKSEIKWIGKNKIYLFFDTAWNPPFRWFEKIVKRFPQLTFEMSYWEPGMFFGGVLIGRNGTASCREYSQKECEEIMGR